MYHDIDDDRLVMKYASNSQDNALPTVIIIIIIIIITIIIGRKLRHAANAPSQPLHNNSYPRTGTFSVVSRILAVKCIN